MPLQDYKRKFWEYVNREEFDKIRGHVDPIEYHHLFVKSATFYNLVGDDNTLSWKNILPVITYISAIAGGIMFFISFLHNLINFQIHLSTECGTYVLIMFYKLFMRITMDNGKKHYHNLLQALHDDFDYISSTEGKKYRLRFFENQKLTFKVCVYVALFLGSIASGMLLCAILAVIVTVYFYSGEDSKRPLPYPFWFFDYDLHVSPVYEIVFAAAFVFTFFHTIQFIFLEQSQMIWIREITCRADVINWNLEDMLLDISPAINNEERQYNDALIRHRIRNIIIMHQAMYDLLEGYAAVFKKCLLFEQIFATPIICLTAYGCAEKLDNGEFALKLFLLCSSAITVAFIPCYLCTHLLEKVQSVGDTCWNIQFWNAGPVMRAYLVLVMQRSKRPLPIVAAGFEDISLESYSRMMSRAYSCFNMLRQADFNYS